MEKLDICRDRPSPLPLKHAQHGRCQRLHLFLWYNCLQEALISLEVHCQPFWKNLFRLILLQKIQLEWSSELLKPYISIIIFNYHWIIMLYVIAIIYGNYILLSNLLNEIEVPARKLIWFRQGCAEKKFLIRPTLGWIKAVIKIKNLKISDPGGLDIEIKILLGSGKNEINCVLFDIMLIFTTVCALRGNIGDWSIASTRNCIDELFSAAKRIFVDSWPVWKWF